MGSATITEEIGEGLYKAIPNFNTAPLIAEIARLEDQSANYWRELNQAIDHRKLMRRDKAMYRETLDALIQQWKDILEKKTQWPPTEAVPEDADEDENNPITGLPYTEEERQDALADEVVDKINAARDAAGMAPLTRSLTLDRQSVSELVVRSSPVDTFPDFIGRDGWLEMLARQKSIQEHGKTVRDAILDAAPGVVMDSIENAMVVGAGSSSDAIAALQRDPETWALLMSPDLNEVGASYRYNPAHPGTHLWTATAVKSLPAPAGNAAFFADPAGQALVAAMETALGPVIAAGLESGPDGGSGGGGSGEGAWQEPWQANFYYGIGAMVTGHRGSGKSMFIMRNNAQAGTSGDTEPVWPGPNATVGDNDLTWLVLAQIPDETASSLESWYDYL